MIFHFLLLGHLIGDFTLQTEKIALNKTKKRRWIALHAVIVTVSMLFFSLPFGLMTMELVLINGFSHYYIDSLKSKLELRTPFLSLVYFMIDQAIHIFIIHLLSILGGRKQSILILNEMYMKFFVALVFIVFFMSIFNQYLLKILYPAYNHVFFFKHEKSSGDITRLALFLIYTLSYWLSSTIILLFIPLLIIMLGRFYKRKLGQWISWSYIFIRLMIDLFVSTSGFYFFLFIYL